MEREAKERELRSLLHSGVVREKTHLHSLLSYLGTRAIEAPDEPLKEHRIGFEALGKPADYDPRIDPTVRVEVAKLRAKLEEFYRTGGAGHPVRLVIPKGGYLPHFEPAPSAPALPASTWMGTGKWLILGILIVAAILPWVVRPGVPRKLAPELEAFWGPHFEGGTPTMLVYGAPLFIKMQGTFFRNPDVNRPEDLGGNEKIQKVLEALKPKESRPAFTYTGVGEAEALFLLARMMAARGAALMVQRSDTVDWEELKGKHVVFLGGRKYNPHLQELPFRPKFEAVNRRIINLEPAAGEPPEYRTASTTPHGEITEEYALISVYPGFTHGTRLLALECSSTEGTLAAAEFVTRPDMVRHLIARGAPLKREDGQYKPFQVVIGAKLNHGVVVSLFYKNYRTLS